MSDELICVVAICKECREAVIYKYIKDKGSKGGMILTSGIPFGVVIGSGTPMNMNVNITPHWSNKPDIEWCECGSDEPRHLCKVTNEELPGLETKCEKCEYRFSCASSRIEVAYSGIK